METEEKEIVLLTKVSKEYLESSLSYYKKRTKMGAYIKVVFISLAVLFLFHNIFIAGNSYEIGTYDTIMYIELGIVGVIILIGFVISGIAISNSLKLKKELTEMGERYKVDILQVQDEFNLIAVNLYGGPGFILKKGSNN